MFSYENLEVYKLAFNVNKKIYTLLKNCNSIPFYVKDQMGRSTLSIMLNIAEGSGKFSLKERKHFFITARGSAFETAAIISFLVDEKEISEAESNSLRKDIEQISRTLYFMVQNLQSKINEPANK